MYNKEFKLKPQELELIESALRGRLSRRAQSRLQHVESTIQDASQLDSVKKIDAEIKEINELEITLKRETCRTIDVLVCRQLSV